MQGTVKLFNPDDAIAGIETDGNQFTIVGLMSDDALELGDVISGALDSEGAATLHNDTKGNDLDAYVEDTGVSEAFAREQIE